MSQSPDRRRTDDLKPDPEMWAALDGGTRLRAILEEFYDLAFKDPRLAPFFERSTLSWVLDHQYAFLRQLFTGEKVYWGYRPRNAHHWMVIDDALFDHREALLEGVLRRHALPEHLVARWRALDERFRPQIVKDAPRPLRLRGQDQPLDGWDPVELSLGTLCDACSNAIDAGEVAFAHVRTGRTLCGACHGATLRSRDAETHA